MIDCQKIIDDYIKWIKDNTIITSVGEDDICEISTPFLDRHNDHLQIYVKKQEDKYILTDDGYTIADLSMSGMDINTPKREQIFRTVLNGYGVMSGRNNELYIEANLNNIGQKKHYLLQAILAVNDMYILSQETVLSLFKEDVERYFKSNDIFFSRDIKITGKTGFDHNIDFLISASKTKPERLIKIINTPKKDPIMAAIFAFSDIISIREQQTDNYVIYNDIDKQVSPDVVSALNNYKVKNIPWSKKEICKEELIMN